VTVIVGLETPGGYVLGADTATTAGGDVVYVRGSKLLRYDVNGKPLVIGHCGAHLVQNELRYAWKPPKPKSEDPGEFFYAVAESLRRHFDHPRLDKIPRSSESDNQGAFDAAWLGGWAGQLFVVDGYFSVDSPADGWYAIGSGDSYAFGALAATQRMNPELRMKRALEAAERFSTGVQRPFHFEWEHPDG
jgi:hypothetical protein